MMLYYHIYSKLLCPILFNSKSFGKCRKRIHIGHFRYFLNKKTSETKA